MSHVGKRFEGLRYSDSLPPGAIFTKDQNWYEATPEENQRYRRWTTTSGEIIITGLFACGAPPVGVVLGLIFIGENIVRYKRLTNSNDK